MDMPEGGKGIKHRANFDSSRLNEQHTSMVGKLKMTWFGFQFTQNVAFAIPK